MKRLNGKDEPKIAPGIDDEKELEQQATKEEKENGEYTEVTTVTLEHSD